MGTTIIDPVERTANDPSQGTGRDGFGCACENMARASQRSRKDGGNCASIGNDVEVEKACTVAAICPHPYPMHQTACTYVPAQLHSHPPITHSQEHDQAKWNACIHKVQGEMAATVPLQLSFASKCRQHACTVAAIHPRLHTDAGMHSVQHTNKPTQMSTTVVYKTCHGSVCNDVLHSHESDNLFRFVAHKLPPNTPGGVQRISEGMTVHFGESDVSGEPWGPQVCNLSRNTYSR